MFLGVRSHQFGPSNTNKHAPDLLPVSRWLKVHVQRRNEELAECVTLNIDKWGWKCNVTAGDVMIVSKHHFAPHVCIHYSECSLWVRRCHAECFGVSTGSEKNLTNSLSCVRQRVVVLSCCCVFFAECVNSPPFFPKTSQEDGELLIARRYECVLLLVTWLIVDLLSKVSPWLSTYLVVTATKGQRWLMGQWRKLIQLGKSIVIFKLAYPNMDDLHWRELSQWSMWLIWRASLSDHVIPVRSRIGMRLLSHVSQEESHMMEGNKYWFLEQTS